MSGFDRGGGRDRSRDRNDNNFKSERRDDDRGGGRGGGGGGRDHGGRGGGGGGGGRDYGGRGGGGGGGRDYGGGGRGGGRDSGGRGRGKNKSMADIPAVQATLSGPGMTDRDIVTVLCPTNRDRSAHVENPRLPPHADWRNQTTIGFALQPGTHNVRANYFRVDPRNIPGRFFQYHIHIRAYERTGILKAEDSSQTEDYRINVALVMLLQTRHPEWKNIGGVPVGFTYDARSTVFTTKRLPLPEVNSDNQDFLAEDIAVPNIDGTESRRRFKISITFTTSCVVPAQTEEDWRYNQDTTLVRALDSSLLAFARQQLHIDNPQWYISGNVGYSSTGETMKLAPGFVAMRGFFVGLKTCLAGLVLVSDMSVSVFLNGGPIINVVADMCGYRNHQDFVADVSPRGIRPEHAAIVNGTLKNTKIKLLHLGHTKKFKSLGPPANHKDSSFTTDDNRKITVADYYQDMARRSQAYNRHLQDGKLRFPGLPTVNVGSPNKPILIPMELVIVDRGQNFSHKCTGDMTAQIIKHAAVVPDERFKNLLGSMGSAQSLIGTIKADPTTAAFGVADFELEPLAVACRLLPPPKLRYGNQEFNPGLAGSWNIMVGSKPVKFIRNPPAPARDGTYMYGVLLVGRLPNGWEAPVENFQREIENDANVCGLKLKRGGSALNSSDRVAELTAKLQMMMTHGARLVLVILCGDYYCNVKYAADPMGLTTQCLKWKNIDRLPKGYVMNVLLKINTKMGGTNHTLSSRLTGPPTGTQVYQDPPASLSWVFDKPCMLVGIDVSHAEPGSDRRSVAAVVGSLNGQASQYAAHISAQAPRVEIVAALEDAMTSLFQTFRQRNNGTMPQHVVVYRDGVGDGQFNEVLDRELPCIQNALAAMGTHTTKITIVICQKRHNTRLVYEDTTNTFLNVCPGVCVDSTGDNLSIASATFNEFYLNSHTAIQGTAKSCKYSLLYDEIGFKTSELELLTYWSCYLYSRCNKSVSLATPAYYAHWASRRARYLFTAGASEGELTNISNTWSQPNRHSTMFFI